MDAAFVGLLATAAVVAVFVLGALAGAGLERKAAREAAEDAELDAAEARCEKEDALGVAAVRAGALMGLGAELEREARAMHEWLRRQAGREE